MPEGLKWRHLVEGWVIIGAATYGAGWLFFALFYAEFEVTPEQAGINFQFITTRLSFFLTIAGVFVLGVVAGFPRRVSRFLQNGDWNVAHRTFMGIFCLVQLVLIAVIVLGVSAWRPWRAFDGPWNLAVVACVTLGSIVLVLLQMGIVLSEVNYRAFEKAVVVRPRMASFIAIVLVGSLILIPLLTFAPRVAASVRDGHEFTWFGVRVNAVRVAWADPSIARQLGIDASEPCAMLLGTHDGSHVLYFREAERTIITAVENVSIARVLDGPCAAGKGKKK